MKIKDLLLDDNYKIFKQNNQFKDKIIINDSMCKGLDNYKMWLSMGITYKKVSHYNILKDGTIYKHLEPDAVVNVLNDEVLSNECIVITLENHNAVTYKAGKYYDFFGNDITDNVHVVEKEWRGQFYWDNYSIEQYTSLKELIKDLKNKFLLSGELPDSNEFMNGFGKNYLASESNITRNSISVNPLFNFNNLQFI